MKILLILLVVWLYLKIVKDIFSIYDWIDIHFRQVKLDREIDIFTNTLSEEMNKLKAQNEKGDDKNE